jgi:hypothetical protein
VEVEVTRADLIREQVDRIIARAVMRGAAQRRREDPDDDENQESASHFDADENARLLLVHPSKPVTIPRTRKSERRRQ